MTLPTFYASSKQMLDVIIFSIQEDDNMFVFNVYRGSRENRLTPYVCIKNVLHIK